MKIISWIIIGIIVLIGVTFASLNPDVVKINYFIGQNSLPLSLLLVLVFTLGCILGLCVGMPVLLKMKIKCHRLKKRLTNAEKEIQNLRVIPIQNRH